MLYHEDHNLVVCLTQKLAIINIRRTITIVQHPVHKTKSMLNVSCRTYIGARNCRLLMFSVWQNIVRLQNGSKDTQLSQNEENVWGGGPTQTKMKFML